ncbi:hypothetical protein MASR2M78_04080 [Treponema sp.]
MVDPQRKQELYKSTDGSTWQKIELDTSVASYQNLDSIYAAGPTGSEELFVGAHDSDRNVCHP